MAHLNVTGGLDIGNGYTKAVLAQDAMNTGRQLIDLPSSMATVTHVNTTPISDAAAATVVNDDFYNQLDATFDTALVTDHYRHLFGRRGLRADSASVDVFSGVGKQSKAQQPLSHALVLGLVAGYALQSYLNASEGAMPEEIIEVSAHLGLSLPITEFAKYRENYVRQFLDGTHTVTINNFVTPVTVRIDVVDVQVVAEGASAQYAINELGAPLMRAMFKDLADHGIDTSDYTAEDVVAARNTLGIDIGEGTVNFPVFTDGKFNLDASHTFNRGYGSVLDETMAAMDAADFKHGFATRKHLAEFLLGEPSPMKRRLRTSVQTYLDKAIDFFTDEVTEQFGRMLEVAGSNTEVIYVYGGGSGPVREVLYTKLLAKVKGMFTNDMMPVFYLNSAYSRNLNRQGLFIASKAAQYA